MECGMLHAPSRVFVGLWTSFISVPVGFCLLLVQVAQTQTRGVVGLFPRCSLTLGTRMYVSLRRKLQPGQSELFF